MGKLSATEELDQFMKSGSGDWRKQPVDPMHKLLLMVAERLDRLHEALTAQSEQVQQALERLER